MGSRAKAFDLDVEPMGWKAGFVSATAREALGLDGLLAGCLTEETLLESGASIDVGGWSSPAFEAEVAVRLGTDLPAGADPDGAAAAIDAVAAAIELIDPDESLRDPEQIMDLNVFHRRFLLGEFLAIEDRAALDAVRIDVEIDSETIAAAVDPRDELGALGSVVAGVARRLAPRDIALNYRDIIITGAAIPPIAVTGGERFTVRLSSSEAVIRID